MALPSHAIIAAAGLGSRVGLGVPKCLMRLNGHPLISYQLHLLRHIPEISIIVGHKRHEVAELVSSYRKGVRFFVNNIPEQTKVLQSLSLAAREIDSNCLFIDGDLLVEEASFVAFISSLDAQSPRIAIAHELSMDPIYAEVVRNGGRFEVLSYNRQIPTPYEWVGLGYVPAAWLQDKPIDTFDELASHAPLPAHVINRIEIDRVAERERADSVLRENPGYCGHL